MWFFRDFREAPVGVGFKVVDRKWLIKVFEGLTILEGWRSIEDKFSFSLLEVESVLFRVHRKPLT